MAHIPAEVQAEIIDIHRHNFHQLRSMSQVCNFWRYRCNRSLFQLLQLTPSSILHFSQLVSISFSRKGILRHVAHLWLGGHDDESGVWDSQSLEILQNILSMLQEAPKLTELTLPKNFSSLLQLGFIEVLPLHLPRVRALHLSDVHFNNPSEFASFFNGFRSVNYVALKDVTVPNVLSPLRGSTTTSPYGCFTLSLQLNDNGKVRRYLRWKPSQRCARLTIQDVAILHSASTPDALRTGSGLFLAAQGFSHIEVLAKACHGCKYTHSLSSYYNIGKAEFRRYYPDHGMWQLPSEKIDLSSACDLQSLAIGSSRCVLSLLTWVPTLLNQIPESAALKDLRIVFASSRQIDLDRPFIRWLANTILTGRGPFLTLECIHFMAVGTLGDQEIEERISTVIANEFRDRGDLVRFSFSP